MTTFEVIYATDKAHADCTKLTVALFRLSRFVERGEHEEAAAQFSKATALYADLGRNIAALAPAVHQPKEAAE